MAVIIFIDSFRGGVTLRFAAIVPVLPEPQINYLAAMRGPARTERVHRSSAVPRFGDAAPTNSRSQRLSCLAFCH
jgi:hypothetical protein